MKTLKVSVLLSLMTFFFSKDVPSQTWTSPIGIPDPGFGIADERPSRPADWTNPVPGYYYVNYETGDDYYGGTNTYGTPAHPRRSIPRPVPAGSYVEVHGNYERASQGVIWVQGNGTDETWVANTSGPVWIVGENENNKPNFTTYTTVIYGSYIYFDLINWNNHSNITIGEPGYGYTADHIVIRNCVIEGDGINNYGGIAINGTETNSTHHIVVYKNIIRNLGDMNSSEDRDVCGATVSDFTNNVWFLENHFYNIGEHAARVGGASPNTSLPENCHHIYFGKNIIHNTRHSGLWVKYAQDVVFSQNHIYDIIQNAAYDDRACMGAQYGPRRFWMLFNILHGARGGISIVGDDSRVYPLPVYAIGNVIYDIHDPDSSTSSSYSMAGIQMRGGTAKYIVNNTICNVDAGIYMAPSSVNFTIENNIIANIMVADGYHINIENIGDSVARNNLFYQNSGAIKIRWGSSNFTTTAAFNSSAYGHNNIEGNPLFVDAQNNNFALQSSSPAIGNGTVSSVYQTFQDLYGIDIRKDIEGTNRPQNGTWDIGACEFTLPSALGNNTLILRTIVLDQNYPNPFNPTTVIRYFLPEMNYVTLKVYDVVGREFTTLVDGRQTERYHTIQR